jgi:hypothetical protein
MAIYCPGCNKFDISSWPNNHYVGGSAAWGGGSTTDVDYVFCFSCWDAFENLIMNTNIDKTALILCSAHASAGTASWKSGISTAILYVAGISTEIDQL